MQIASRQTFANDGGLPYDAEVDWIKSVRAGKLSTGYVPALTDIIAVEFMINVAANNLCFLASRTGGWNSVPNKWLALKWNKQIGRLEAWCFRSTKTVYFSLATVSWTRGNRVILRLNLPNGTYAVSKPGYGLAGQIGAMAAPAANQPPVTLNDEFFEVTYYAFRAERGGVAVADLIPVRVGGDGAMYDRVSGILLSAGTGVFTPGPDKS